MAPTRTIGRVGWFERLPLDSLEKAQEEEPAPFPPPALARRAMVTCFSAGQPAACLYVSPAGQTCSPKSFFQTALCSPWAVVSTFSGTFGQKAACPLTSLLISLCPLVPDGGGAFAPLRAKKVEGKRGYPPAWLQESGGRAFVYTEGNFLRWQSSFGWGSRRQPGSWWLPGPSGQLPPPASAERMAFPAESGELQERVWAA